MSRNIVEKASQSLMVLLPPFAFSKSFILLRVTLEPEPILGTLGEDGGNTP